MESDKKVSHKESKARDETGEREVIRKSKTQLIESHN